MGNFIGFSDTQFVGTAELGAVSSYEPCHLFGDPMLIGAGIRIGFYLLYFAAIIAVLFGVDQQFRIWNAAWATVALAIFVSLCLNATGATLVVVDWAVLIQLVLWFPVFFLQAFRKQILNVADKRDSKSVQDVQAQLAHRTAQAISMRDAARARAYADVLKAFAAYAALEQVEGDYEAAREELSRSIETYTMHWREQADVVDGHRSTTEEVDIDGGFTATVYNASAIADIVAAPTRGDVDAFRENYIAAMANAEIARDVALSIEAEAARIAAEEASIKRRSMRPKHAAWWLFWGTDFKDKIAAVLALLVWSAYQYAAPWLWFTGIQNGRKPECDAYVELRFVFAPYNPYDQKFITFLEIFSCGAIVVALFVTIFAFALIVAGLLPRRLRRWIARRRHGNRRRGEERADYIEEARATEYSAADRRQNTDEILVSVHARESQASHRHSHSRRAAPSLSFDLFNIAWALLLVVLLIETIVTLELMIDPPHSPFTKLDFGRPNLYETAEILAFLIGLLILLLVIWSVFDGFFQFFTRKQNYVATTTHHHHTVKEKEQHHGSSREALWAKKQEQEQSLHG